MGGEVPLYISTAIIIYTYNYFPQISMGGEVSLVHDVSVITNIEPSGYLQ